MVAETLPNFRVVQATAASEITVKRANLELGLVILAEAFNLPLGSALMLMTLDRTPGLPM